MSWRPQPDHAHLRSILLTQRLTSLTSHLSLKGPDHGWLSERPDRSGQEIGCCLPAPTAWPLASVNEQAIDSPVARLTAPATTRPHPSGLALVPNLALDHVALLSTP